MSAEAESEPNVTPAVPRRSATGHALVALVAIVGREAGDFARNYRRSLGDILIGIAVFVAVAAGFDEFRRALTEPYGTYVTFVDYLVPGVAGLVIMVATARSATTLVAGHGSDSVRFLMAAPLPRWFVLLARLLAIALIVTVQAAIFVVGASLLGSEVDLVGWLIALPAILLGAFTVAALFAVLATFLRPARSLATLLLYVIVPVFFVSTALYPLWRLGDSGAEWLEAIASANPFTHVTELIRYASEGQFAATSFLVVAGVGIAAFALGVIGIDPKRRFLTWRRTGGWASQPD